MVRKKRRRRKKQTIPLSHNYLVDTLFKLLLRTHKKRIKTVRLMPVLKDPDNYKKELCGYMEDGVIYIGKRTHKKKNMPILSTLIHELLHEALESWVGERVILNLEKAIWTGLTDSQKRYLRQFLPKHEVKKNP